MEVDDDNPSGTVKDGQASSNTGNSKDISQSSGVENGNDTNVTGDCQNNDSDDTDIGNSNKSDNDISKEWKTESGDKTDGKKARLCPGHERSLPIEQTVMELDIKEEGKDC